MFTEQLRFLSTYVYVAIVAQGDSLLERLLYDAVHWRKFIPIAMNFIDQLKVIFKNPRRYPREAVTIIATVIISFLLIVLLVALVMSAKRQFAIYRASRRVKKKLPREEVIRRLTMTGIAFVVFVAALTITTAQPQFCVRCHEIEKSHAEWEKSAHKDVGCLSCHHEPGLFGYMIGVSEGADNLLTHFLYEERMTRAVVSNDSCLKCHGNVFNQTVSNDREIRIRHKDLVTGGMVCTNCHAGIAHETKTGKVFAMNRCVSCHNGRTAKTDCKSCHQQDIAYKPGQNLDDWPKVKSLGLTCVGCHKVETDQGCVNCHGLVLPHPAEFKRKHAMESEKSNGALCYKCHWDSKMSENRMCGCHDEGSIHGKPEGWYFRHRELARNNGAGCNCHGLSFCQRCHDDPTKVYPLGYAGGAGANQMHGGWHTGM